MTCFSTISRGRAILQMQRKGLWVNLKATTLIVSRRATSRGASRDLFMVMLPSCCTCTNHSNYALTCHLLYSLYIASLFNNSYHWWERNTPWTAYPPRKHTAWLDRRIIPVENTAKARTNLQWALWEVNGDKIYYQPYHHEKKFNKSSMFWNRNSGRGTGCKISTEQIIKPSYKCRLDTWRE